ncbi:MAG: hypothetical protein KDB95_11445 [Flavobacteriales bacterium]|nr:hypothetical protein [Flavobacteriales bacterium]
MDHVRIEARSGKGGAGSAHLHREKYKPRGGPDGGDGGRGGHVIMRGNPQLWTLLHLRYTKHVIAEFGEGGSSNQCSGKSGKDAVIEVPLGTVAKDPETGEVVGEVMEAGQEVILAQGGRGGLGNQHFKTAQLKTYYAERGSSPASTAWVPWRRSSNASSRQLLEASTGHTKPSYHAVRSMHDIDPG